MAARSLFGRFGDTLASAVQLALYFFWLLPVPVLAAVAVVMYRRKQHSFYPTFWAYTCIQCIGLVIEFICKFVSYKAYFYAYWTVSSLIALLIVLLLRTVFVRVLETYPSLDSVRRYGFEFAVSAIWLTALAMNIGFMSSQAWPQKIARVGIVVSFTETAVFVFVLVTTLVLGIRWKSTYCGIAIGLGVLGVADLVVYTGLSWVSSFSKPAIVGSWIETLAFDIAVAVFAFYFFPVPVIENIATDIRPELLQWTESMKGAVRK